MLLTRSQHVYFSSGRRVVLFGALAQAVENRTGMQLPIPVARRHEKFEDIKAAHIAGRRPDDRLCDRHFPADPLLGRCDLQGAL
ncbi:hypothetical protein CUJ84_Chr000610 [Rhizobium leguminosarum]|uniref:Uncharacterized protein n=1 Tax=Rhizobium leguminosarum TaxID=384 RepID=A0A2K9YYI9_RHILE|nr:hypothetical protein CUJ84_Chr000610 [Rhizobium leguminosarum]